MAIAVNGTPLEGASGGASLPVSDPAQVFSGATPGCFVTTNGDGDGELLAPATVAAALAGPIEDARVTTLPLDAAAGWTLTDIGAGTAELDTDAESLGGFVPSGAGAVTAGGDVYRAFPAVGPHFRVQGRYTVTADGSADFLTSLGVNWTPGADFLIVHVRGNGALFFEQSGAMFVDTNPGLILGGTGWIRFEVSGLRVRLYTGVGSGTSEPTDWTLRYDGDRNFLAGVARPTRIFGAARTNSGHVAAVDSTGTWHSLSVTDLSLG